MNLALIGLGMVAQTHVNAIKALGSGGEGSADSSGNHIVTDSGTSAKLAGVLSRDTTRSTEFVKRCCRPDEINSIRIFEHVEQIASDPTVDVAVICTPPNARLELVEKLASAGKHILIEKPIERTVGAAKKLVEICEANGVLLGVFLQHRMRASAKEARQVLASGVLGDIAVVEINVPWWREQSYYDEPGRGSYQRDGGGVLISQSIHTLDLALSLLGPVARVQAMARTTKLHNMESEDFVSAGLEFQNGAIGSLVASTASFPGGAESITIHGTLGSAVLISGQLNLSFHDGRKEVFGEEVGTGGGADPMAFTHAWHQAVIEDFLKAVENQTLPAITGRDALAVQVLIETLIASSDQNRALDVPISEHP